MKLFTDLVVVFASTREVATEPEVADLGVLSGHKQNVSRSQVAVYDVVAVEVMHALGNLVHQFYDVRHPHLAKQVDTYTGKQSARQ